MLDPLFSKLTDELPRLLAELLACEPVTGRQLLPRATPTCGVYLFSTAGEHLYVGRTDRLRKRHREHWAGKNNDAPFAFKIARHETGHLRAKGGLKRKELEADPTFAAAFVAAKAKISELEFRWVEEPDPNRQCLLEVYATVVLGAKYNDFMNH